jgi:anti-sigma B factor antagonist
MSEKSNPLEITIDRDGDDVRLIVSGEVDLESSRALSEALSEVVSSRQVSLDLTGVGYMDSTGLRTILVAKEELERAGGNLNVVAASNIVNRLIEISGVSELLGQPEG